MKGKIYYQFIYIFTDFIKAFHLVDEGFLLRGRVNSPNPKLIW